MIDKYGFLLEKAKYFAISVHANQKYAKYFPYEYHLSKVGANLWLAGFGNYDTNINSMNVCCAGWLHDCIEDAGVSYNDIAREFNNQIAEIVYAVTNELGKNRTERNKKTYPKIKNNEYAICVKLADRIANVEFSLQSGEMISKYREEYKLFKKSLYDKKNQTNESEYLWRELDNLLK